MKSLRALSIFFVFVLSATSKAGLFDSLFGSDQGQTKKPYCKYYGPKLTGLMAGPAPIFSADESNWIYDRLDQENLHKQISSLPKSYEEIFFEGKDFKSEIIEARVLESEKYWSQQTDDSLQEQSRNLNYKELKFDIFAWKDLNLQAARTWKSLLDCNANDLNRIRLNFFRGNPCAEDKQKNQAVTSEVSELNSSLAMLVMSTAVWYPIKMDETEVMYRTEYNGLDRTTKDLQAAKNCLQLYNGKYIGLSGLNVMNCDSLLSSARLLSVDLQKRKPTELWLPYTHPLLAQLILQYQAFYSLLAMDWKKNFYLRDIEKEMFMDEADVKYTKDWSEKISPRKAKFPDEAKANVRYAMKFGILSAALIDSNPNTLDYTACSVYGLWPAMNRSIFFATGGMLDYPSSFQEPMVSGKQKALLACGSSIEYLREARGVYSNFAFLHLFEMARLMASYAPEKVKGTVLYESMKSKGLTPFQKQLCND